MNRNDSQPIATAAAKKCRQYRTGRTAYKPVIKTTTPVGRGARTQTTICGQVGNREQGATYLDRADAIAHAQRCIDSQRDKVRKQALGITRARASEVAARFLQGQFVMYGGIGDVFAE